MRTAWVVLVFSLKNKSVGQMPNGSTDGFGGGCIDSDPMAYMMSLGGVGWNGSASSTVQKTNAHHNLHDAQQANDPPPLWGSPPATN